MVGAFVKAGLRPLAAGIRHLRATPKPSEWERYSAHLAEAAEKAEPANAVEDLIELRRSVTLPAPDR